MSGAHPVAPDAVLRRSPELEWREVGEEAVLWHSRHQALHRLDAVGTLVFQLCDGVTPLSVTVEELAETFGRPDGLERDVHELVARLVGVDVLELV